MPPKKPEKGAKGGGNSKGGGAGKSAGDSKGYKAPAICYFCISVRTWTLVI